MAYETTDYLIDQIEKEQKAIDEATASGAAKSFDEYRYMVGRSHGLSLALTVIEEFKQKMEKFNE